MVVWAAARGGAGSDGGLCSDGEGAAVISLSTLRLPTVAVLFGWAVMVGAAAVVG